MGTNGVLFLLLVTAPLMGGVMLIMFARRRVPDHPSCGKCRYNVRASIGSVTRCPECGAEFAEVGIRPPGGHRSPFLIAAGLLLIVLAVSGFGSAVMLQRAAMAQARAATQAAAARAAAAQALAQAAGRQAGAPATRRASEAETGAEAEAEAEVEGGGRTQAPEPTDPGTP